MKQINPIFKVTFILAILAGSFLPGRMIWAAEQAGVSAAVRGDVQLTRLPEIVGRSISSGEAIFLTDRIQSGPASGMQILLLDETIFTIGPGSQLTIDEFVYDPETGAGRVTATVAKGVFRFVTGKVAANRPEDMKVKTPFGTIGIRGTIVAGEVTSTGADVVLLGPGVETNTAERIGRIEVTNDQGSVVVTRPGFGTSIGTGTEPPSAPVQVPPERISALTNSIARPDTAGQADPASGNPGDGGNQGGQASQPASAQQNQQTAGANGSGTGKPVAPGGVANAAVKPPGGSGAGFAGQTQASGIVGLSGLQTTQGTVSKQNLAGQQIVQQIHVQDGVATIADLNSIQSGKIYFDQTVPLASGGTYRFVAEIDFGARQAGGATSRVDIHSLRADIGNLVHNLSAKSFDELSGGIADFGNDGGGPSIVDCASGVGACRLDIGATLKNADGIVGKYFDHSITIYDTIGPVQTDSGSGTAVRQEGGIP